MGYNIALGAWRSVFAVPSEVVDRHLRLAGAAQLKTLLYLLRHADESIEPEQLAKEIGLSVADTLDAVGYWVTCGLLSDDGDRLLPAAQTVEENDACSVQSTAGKDAFDEKQAVEKPKSAEALNAQTVAQTEPEPKDEAVRPKAKEHIRYSYSECCGMMSEDSELRDMLGLLESLLARQLNHSEISVFITLVKWYGLQPASVVLLAEYCRSIGSLSIAYIEKAGCGWAADGITTVDQANEKILRLRAARSAWNVVRTTLGMPERVPTKKEEELCGQWINDWHTDLELIRLAYDRCIEAKGKYSVSYMNGIISNWRKKELFSLERVLEHDAASKPSKTEAGQKKSSGRYAPTYDIDEIEAMLDAEWNADEQ